MAIRNWHYGKIILLWVWGLLLVVLSLNVLESVGNFLIGFPLIGVIVGIPVALSVITWKWLSGKENNNAKEN